MSVNLYGAVKGIPELGGRVFLATAPQGTQRPAAIYAVVWVVAGSPVLTVFDQGSPALPDTLVQNYQRVTLYDAARSGESLDAVAARLYAVMQQVQVVARTVDTDLDRVTPAALLRANIPPVLLEDPNFPGSGFYMTVSYPARTVQ